MRGWRRWTTRAVAGAALSLTGMATGTAVNAASDASVLVTAVVASMDGTPITLVDLEAFENGMARLLPPSERDTRAAALDSLLRMKMFQAEFDKQGIKASDEDVNIYIDNLLAENQSSREATKEVLKKLGVSWDLYFERMRQDLERMALMSREIRSRVNITPQDVERAWKEDPAYRTPEKIEVGDIFIPIGTGRDARERSRATADEAYEAARRNFAKAARKYSAGPNAQEGGILGTFVRDELAGGFVEALEKLEPGDVAPPFEADGAFHVVKLVRVVPSVPVPLDEVRGAIEDRLYSETLEARFNRWIDEDLRKRHHVTVQLQDIQALVAEENRS